MKISIDGTNIKTGGGLTHLKQILENHSAVSGEIEIIGGFWLEKIKEFKWLKKRIFKNEFSSVVKQELFKLFRLPNILQYSDIVFAPGGTFSSKRTPYVSMSQNMLVFEEFERNRFPKRTTWLRYLALERSQLRSFRNAKGIIYISNYAKNYIEKKYPDLKKKRSRVIYHGISENFREKPRLQKNINDYTFHKPFVILYVSIVNFYKHQWNVIEAIKMLKKEGFPIVLDLIGPMYEPARKKFEKALVGTTEFINYRGKVEYEDIAKFYKRTDMFIFASTCENMPNILVEAMSAGLPILSSNFGPMPEILRDGGVYMDPTDSFSIYYELKKLLLNPNERERIANRAYYLSQSYSWIRTSEDTFNFIQEVYEQEVLN